MRIAFLEQQPRFIGGSERMSLSICRHALQRGHSAWLVYAEAGDMVSSYFNAGATCIQIPVLPIAVRHPIQAWRSARSMSAVARDEKIDLIFTSQISYVSLLAVAGRWTSAKTVVHLGLTYDFTSPLFRSCMALVDLGIVPSSHTANDWRLRGWPDRSLRVIGNGVDLNVFCRGDGRDAARRRLGLPLDAIPVVAYVGRLVREKGIFTLLRAFAAIHRTGKGGFLVMVGMAPNDEMDKLERLAIEERLPRGAWQILPPMLKPEDVYRAADIVVVPSEWEEPFGLVPLEAMACGTFTLVSNRGVLPQFVAPVGDMAVFSAGDVASLAARIEHWLDNSDARRAAAGALEQHVRSLYSMEQCGDAYLAEFQKQLSR